MPRIDFSFEIGGEAPRRVSAFAYPAGEEPLGAWVLLAHGAGAGQESPFMVGFAQALADRGLHVATFNFPYIEQRRRMPDSNVTLEACYRAAIRAVGERAENAAVFIGGKSMGGRIASQVAAAPHRAAQGLAGLVFLGYPLHPPGKPDQPRTRHWPEIEIPALFVQGSRDPFATPDELRAALAALGAPATVHIVEGGDHSFKVRGRTGGAQAQVHEQIQDAIVTWVRARLVAPPC
jgi:predicted alpha/beta-hydrolase family hydrolase